MQSQDYCTKNIILIAVMAVKMKILLPRAIHLHMGVKNKILIHDINVPIYFHHSRIWGTEAIKASREISADLGLQSRWGSLWLGF